MEVITIKPHHFIDIIKLYGSGIDLFIPDRTMKHDFYKIANKILNNHHITLNLTIESDDICHPCLMHQKKCTDTISHIPDYHFKEDYNQTLDKRIISFYKLNKQYYFADELCLILLEKHEFIDQIWSEENDEITKKRHHLFVLGAKIFLQSS